METNVNYTMVGVFVISLLTMIVLGIIWLSAGLSVQSYTTYQVYMTESVSGINPDSPVEFNGVSVGSVKSVELNRRNPRIVELLLKVKSDTPITEATRATLTSRGLTGVAYIALKDPGTDVTLLKALPGQEYPVIKTAPSLFLQLDTALQKLDQNMHAITKTVQSLFDEENLRSIKETLHNLQTITGTFAADSQQMDAIMKNFASATKQLPQLFQSFTTSVQVMQTQTLPAANQALMNFSNMNQSVSRLSKDISKEPSILIRGKAQPALGPGEQ